MFGAKEHIVKVSGESAGIRCMRAARRAAARADDHGRGDRLDPVRGVGRALGDTARALNGGDRSRVVGSAGIGFSY
jgi:hypothetical protein